MIEKRALKLKLYHYLKCWKQRLPKIAIKRAKKFYFKVLPKKDENKLSRTGKYIQRIFIVHWKYPCETKTWSRLITSHSFTLYIYVFLTFFLSLSFCVFHLKFFPVEMYLRANYPYTFAFKERAAAAGSKIKEARYERYRL